eukprot:gnl/Spiro4/16526_TR8900_c0_g1_i1.p1 gnl/Spiro4/16526_TR8900_c0_g1~~gnl/Spiro4/16526_TR8900_c0_g1_i1.p1  ORF type:complete len:414 (-),score=-5.47 gnl/Spiro4/16526_TR8900_c0_g1_i1:1556-2797(-)
MMARLTSKLTALTVQKLKEPGLYNDGGGLYLKIGPTGGKSWVFRYKVNKKPHFLGLGPIALVSLQEAREITIAHRKSILRGEDPLQQRQRSKVEQLLEQARTKTFDQCFEEFFVQKAEGLRNPKHRAQWRSTMSEYVSPVIGKIPVQEIDVPVIRKVLDPIWTEIPETANRVRNRIEQVLDWAAANTYRKGDNPSRWVGHLDKIYPKRSEKFAPKKNFASLHYQEVGSFLADLRKRNGISHRALEFLILTAARTSEALGAKWSEIDLTNRIWTIPPERMKAGKSHRVPLSPRTIEILQSMPRVEGSEYVFSGFKERKHLSNMALLKVIKDEMNFKVTTHGFRSTFSTWAREKTATPRDVVEMCLAHKIESAVEAAYMRGDLFMKRLALMDQWAKFCDTPMKAGTVIDIQAKNA